jgi:hypothetical protein
LLQVERLCKLAIKSHLCSFVDDLNACTLELHYTQLPHCSGGVARVQVEEERLRKLATKTHRDRINEFNDYLSVLSEHHDIPKVRRQLCTLVLITSKTSS